MKYSSLILLVIFLSGCQIYLPARSVPVKPTACTLEAKLCPDGSYVGRVGPNCEFSACPIKPVATTTPTPPEPASGTGIMGTSLIGPTCPVERIPPDPNCAPRPFPALIIVKTADGSSEVTSFNTGADGKFKVNLLAGTYLLVPQSANVYPRGITQAVIVKAGGYTAIEINFDSGIR